MNAKIILNNQKVKNSYNQDNISLPPLKNVPKRGFSS